MLEYVLVVIKPDGMKRGLTGHVINRFSQLELKMIAAQVLTVTEELANQHYKHLNKEPFYSNLIDLITGKLHGQKQVLALIYSGENAIERSRDLAGATNPEEADPKSIRGAFGRLTTKGIFENVIHVSSDNKEAEREIKLWFKPEQIEGEIYPTKEDSSSGCHKKIWV